MTWEASDVTSKAVEVTWEAVDVAWEVVEVTWEAVEGAWEVVEVMSEAVWASSSRSVEQAVKEEGQDRIVPEPGQLYVQTGDPP